jgi:hypothetical protein
MTQPKKYSRFIERILPNLGDEFKKIEVKGIYGGQIGHLVLSPADFVSNEESGGLELKQLLDVADDDDDADIGDGIEKEIISALRRSPHTFGLKTESLPKISNYQSNFLRYSFDFDEFLSFSIKVPASKKKFDYVNDEIEQFEVLMAGSNHIAFVELDDCPEGIFIGQEFREQMRELLDIPENIFRLGQVGPAPINPRIYVVDFKSESFKQRSITFYDDDLYILADFELSNCSAKEIYQDILELSGFQLDIFYSLSKVSSLLLDLHRAIHQKLQQTVEAYMQLGANLFFIRFWKLAELRMDLLLIHKGSLELELQLDSYESQRKSFFSILENNIFLDDMKNYFRDVSEPEIPMGNALFKTLEYMEKSISSVDVAIRTIFAAVMGASVGVFVTLLLKL